MQSSPDFGNCLAIPLIYNFCFYLTTNVNSKTSGELKLNPKPASKNQRKKSESILSRAHPSGIPFQSHCNGNSRLCLSLTPRHNPKANPIPNPQGRIKIAISLRKLLSGKNSWGNPLFFWCFAAPPPPKLCLLAHCSLESFYDFQEPISLILSDYSDFIQYLFNTFFYSAPQIDIKCIREQQ